MPDNVFTVRERVLRQIHTNIKNMRKDVGGYNTTFKHTTREVLLRSQKFACPAVSILDPSSRIIDGVSFITHHMTVQCEFFIDRPVSKSVTASQLLGVVLADLQRLFLANLHTVEDGTGDELTLNVQMVGDEYDLDTATDKRASCTLELLVQFRHNKLDPTALRAGPP